MKVKETDLVRECLRFLHLKNILAWRANAGLIILGPRHARRIVRVGPNGLPDIIGLLPGGRFLAIECKLPGSQPTETQRAFHRSLVAQGAVVAVVHSLDELNQVLEENLHAQSDECRCRKSTISGPACRAKRASSCSARRSE